MTDTTPTASNALAAIREAMKELMTPIGNMTDAHSRITRSLERQNAYTQAVSPHRITAVLDHIAHLEARVREAEERLCRTQAAHLVCNKEREVLQDRLSHAEAAILAHNAACEEMCEQRQQNGDAHCPYAKYGRQCPDCPRDGMVDAARAADGKDGAR